MSEERTRDDDARADGGSLTGVDGETDGRAERTGESSDERDGAAGGPSGAPAAPGSGGAAAESDAPPAVHVHDLVVGYPSADEPVLDGESVTLPAGQVTAFVGPNGSGKSTLLKSIARQIDVDGGQVYLDGRDVHGMSSGEFARAVGLLSQENDAPESLTVEELVAHGRYPHRGFFESLGSDDQEAIDRAISMAGVEELREREVRTLSGGQRQLVWIAMALAQETDVLLLDEPTTFLDLRHQLQVMGIVETLRDRSDVTVGLVLHDVEQAARYADRVVALRDGELHAAGPPEEVITEELLADVFGIEATVTRSDRGPRITPEAPAATDDERDRAAPEGDDGERRRAAPTDAT